MSERGADPTDARAAREHRLEWMTASLTLAADLLVAYELARAASDGELPDADHHRLVAALDEAAGRLRTALERSSIYTAVLETSEQALRALCT